MGLTLIATLFMAQILTSPHATATTCAPTAAKRIKPVGSQDDEWHGTDKWCTGTACFIEEVLVTVDPNGTVKSAVVRKSWGTGPDAAVLAAARSSKYISATVNCEPVEGTYVFREMFTVVH
jgi:hypothetical protein